MLRRSEIEPSTVRRSVNVVWRQKVNIHIHLVDKKKQSDYFECVLDWTTSRSLHIAMSLHSK
jgi:hypothetical protein